MKPTQLTSEDGSITLKEIAQEKIAEFWDLHIDYLISDGIITDQEDIDYFRSDEYRKTMEAQMSETADRQHMAYFMRAGQGIGAVSWCLFTSENGLCFIMDFWVFRQFRGSNTGHDCFLAFERYVQKEGAVYYQLNSTKPDSIRFWQSLGFSQIGCDEYGMPLFEKR